MNTSESHLFDAASPEVFYIDSSLPLELPTHTVPDEGPISVNLGAREATRQRWEELKPFIKQTYIKENKPFPYLAEILRRDHSFEPTKRQFSRKIIEWGFRKNVPMSERRLILQKLSSGSQENMPKFKDLRLKPTKLNNWRKRYREEVRNGRCLPNEARKRFQEAPSVVRCEAFMEGKGEMKSTISTASTAKNFRQLSGNQAINSANISFMDMCQNGLPFDWSKVDVLEVIPELVPLFQSLRLVRDSGDQSSPFDETEVDDSVCLSKLALQGLSSNGSDAKIDNLHAFSITKETSDKAIKHRATNKSPQYPWRDIHNVFCGYSTSPLNEVYVFSPCQKSLRTGKSRVVNLWGSLIAQESKLEMKLFKLESQFGDHNPAVIAVMECLSALYCRLDYYRKAELMRRRLVDVYGRILGPTNRRTLQARLAVVGSLLAQGQYLKAQAENQTLRSSILELFENGHPLTVSANYTYAKICTASGRTEETERYYRQHLQTMLSLHGPRAIQTVKAMLCLSGEISRRIPKEADILLRIAGQLSIELPPVDENSCRSLRFVIGKLLGLGAYEESYCMATKLVERYSLPLGDQHPALWKAREKLAWSMRALGDLQKSITIFRAAISHQEERALGFDHSHVNSWCGLADLLSQTGEIEEATMWYKKTFEGRTAFYGSYNDFTLSTAYCLGYCYYKQCRYDEALNLYGKMVQSLHESGQGGRAIRDFELYILHIHRKIDEKKEVEGFREL